MLPIKSRVLRQALRPMRLCSTIGAWVATLLFVTGCATTQPLESDVSLSLATLIDTPQFGPRPDIPDATAVHELAPDQVAEFKRYLFQPSLKFNPIHSRVASYLHLITSNFSYDERTLAARDSYAEQSGNCMSLAVLTTALARVAEVEVGYQLMNEAPVFQWQGDLLLNGQHLRSVLFAPMPQSNTFVTMRGGIRVDYFPTAGSRFVRRVADPEYLSMFYNNLAVQALSAGDYRKSYWLLREALNLLPDSSDTLNTMALLFRRSGDNERAETIYRTSLKAMPNAVVMLRNYRSFLRGQNRTAEANAINAKLHMLDEVSPIDWLRAGTTEYATGNYSEAAFYFKKALGIAPYLHEAHLGLAQTYFAMDDNHNTRRQLELALDNAQRTSTRSLYQAKLRALAKLDD